MSLKDYNLNGYYHFKSVFSLDFCDKLIEKLKELEPRVFIPYTDIPWGYGQLFDVSPFNDMLKNETIFDFCDELFDDEEYVVNHFFSSNKCSFLGPEEMWHQEVANIDTFAPGCIWEEDWKNFLQIIIALDEQTLENGCLKLIPKSHQLGKLLHTDIVWNNHGHKRRISRDEMKRAYEFGGIKNCEMKRGDVLVFNHLIAHCSPSNQSPFNRRVLLMQVQSHGKPKDMEVFERESNYRKNFLINEYQDKIKSMTSNEEKDMYDYNR
jgi:hypothetical protein